MNRSAPKHAESEVAKFFRIDASLHTRVLFHLWTGGHGDSHVESLAKRESFTRAQFFEHPVLAVKIKPLLAISTENICLRPSDGKSGGESLAKRKSFTRAQFFEHPVLAVKIKPLLAISTENLFLRLPKGLRRP